MYSIRVLFEISVANARARTSRGLDWKRLEYASDVR